MTIRQRKKRSKLLALVGLVFTGMVVGIALCGYHAYVEAYNTSGFRDRFEESLVKPGLRRRCMMLEADFDQTYLNESEEVEPLPEFGFDQTVSW